MEPRYEIIENKLVVKIPSEEVVVYTREQLEQEKAEHEARIAQINQLLAKFDELAGQSSEETKATSSEEPSV
jgi:hypothetical protein